MDKDFSFDALLGLCRLTHQEIQYRASHTVDFNHQLTVWVVPFCLETDELFLAGNTNAKKFFTYSS